MGPLLMGMSLNITVFSYCGHIDFGFMVCPEAVPDPFPLADAHRAGPRRARGGHARLRDAADQRSNFAKRASVASARGFRR